MIIAARVIAALGLIGLGIMSTLVVTDKQYDPIVDYIRLAGVIASAIGGMCLTLGTRR